MTELDTPRAASRPQAAAAGFATTDLPPTPAATRPARRPALDSLTGLRGAAAMLIFLTHAGLEPVFKVVRINTTMTHYLLGIGEAAVSFFFMLSGFVLVWAARPDETRRAFWRRRIVKIYPNQIVVWTLATALMVVAGEVRDPATLLPSLPLVHSWIPIEPVLGGNDGPAWSLSCEVFFYALFPWLSAWVLSRSADHAMRRLNGVVAIAVTVTVAVGLLVPDRPMVLGLPADQAYLLIFFPPVRLLDFLIGMLVARLVIEARLPRAPWPLIVALSALGALLGLVLPAPLGDIVPMMPASVLLIVRCARDDAVAAGEPRKACRPATPFSGRRIVWLGEVSFAFYLVHWLVLHYSRVFLGGGPWSTPVATAVLAADFVVALGLAAALHHLVERPAMARWAAQPPRRR